MRLILADQSSKDQYARAVTSERLVNVYPVPAPSDAQGQFILRNVPGTRDKATLPGPFFRAAAFIEGTLYAVSAGGLYSIGRGGSVVKLADVDDDANTTIAGHRDKVTVAADGNYYVLSAGTLTSPAPGRLTNVGSVAFLDQFTLLSQRDGREIEWTEVGDPTDRNGLNFATAEGEDDKILRHVRVGPYLMALKERTTELWANTGEGGFSAFRRIPGMVHETGLLAFNLLCQPPESVFFVGDDRVAYLSNGQSFEPVSTPQVNQALLRNRPTHCFYYEDRGHRFAVIRFGDRPAWVYDLATGIWHERATGADLRPWDVVEAVNAYGEWHLFERTGRVYTLGVAPTDATGVMRRMIVSRKLYGDGARFKINMLEFHGEFGRYSVIEDAPGPVFLLDQAGLEILDQTDQPIRAQENTRDAAGRPAKMELRTSKDGVTFGLPKVRELGRVGQYDATCRYRGLGQFRQFAAEVSMTDPVEIHIMSEANVG